MDVEIERLKILRGETLQTPPEPPNFVRIFLSSTFHDFRHERNYLFINVFPELESWCRERGLEFQVVDLRWGIREGSSMEHSGVLMCLKEVRNCQKWSIGPNFVALLGNRYGRRPLPPEIPESEFSVILENCHGKDKVLLTSYYLKDENAIPPVYILKGQKPIAAQENANEIQADDWAKTEVNLKAILRAVVSEVNKRQNSPIDDTAAYKYFTSVTEQEIWEGILKAKEPEKHSICFMRKFQQYQFTKATAKYVDIMPDGSVDEESKVLLHNLTNFLIPLKLDTNNVFHFSIPFDPQSGVDAEKLAKHRVYLKALGSKLKENVRNQIVDGLKALSHRIDDHDQVYKEVNLQAKFCVSNCELYCGQEQLLSTVLQILSEQNEEGHHSHPLVLHGISGCGKTATLAKIVQLASEQYAHKYNLVYRFLGVTPKSGSIDNLLKSICDQIAELYGLPKVTKSIEDYNSLRLAFLQLLESVAEAKSPYSLLIILDSIDQMSPAFDAFSMNWLPLNLPSKVKIIISLNTRLERVITDLKARLNPDCFIEMNLLSNKDATSVLKSLLTKRQRTLQPHQWAAVEKAFEKSQNPLLLELTFVEAAMWRSYTPANEMKLGHSITEAITFLFDRLERDYGKVFVSHAVSNLVLAQNGLTEMEMTEILSLDDAVMQDVYQFWKPPSDTEIAIPPLLWTRLREQIQEFIAVRQADDATVMRFYQKQFDQVVTERYLRTREEQILIYGHLAEYFLGIWASKAKPITLLIAGQNVEYPNAMRMCSQQPIQFGNGPGARFNLRKLNELPHHLYHAGKFDSLITETLVNYNWLHAKWQAMGLQSLIDDFDLYAIPLKHPPLGYIQQTLRLAKPTLEFQFNEDSLAKELLCRLYNLGSMHKRIDMLLQGAKKYYVNITKTDWEPLNQYAQSPHSCLVTTLIGHSAGVNSLSAEPESLKFFASVSVDKTLRIWNFVLGKILHTIKLSDEPMISHMFDGKVLVIFRYGDGQIYDTTTGFLLSEISEEKVPIDTLNLQTSPTHTIAIPGRSQIEGVEQSYLSAQMPNSNILAMAHNHTLRFYDYHLGKIVRMVDTIRPIQFLSKSTTQLMVGLEPNILLFFTSYDTVDKDVKFSNFQHLIWAESVTDHNLLLLTGNRGKQAYLYAQKSTDVEIEPVVILEEPAMLSFVHGGKLVCVAGKTSASVSLVSDNPTNIGEIDVIFGLNCPSEICLAKFLPNPQGYMPMLAIGSRDEMLRVYEVNTKVPKFVLTAIWGGPTSLLVDNNFSLITASSGAPYVKIWNLHRTNMEGSVAETPIHIENFIPMPSYIVQTGINPTFIVSSVDVDGNLVLSDCRGLRQRLEFTLRYESNRLLFIQLISYDRLLTGWTETAIDSLDDNPICSLVKIFEIGIDKEILKEVFVTKLQSEILHWSNNCSLTTGTILITKSKEVVLFETRSHSLRKILNSTTIFDSETVNKLVLCKDTFAVSTDDFVSVFTLKAKMLCRLSEPKVTVMSLRKSQLALISRHNTLKVYNVSSKVPITVIDLAQNNIISSIALSEDLKFVFFGTTSDKSVYQYEVESGLKVRKSYMYGAVMLVESVKDMLVVMTKLGNFCLQRVHNRELPKEKRGGRLSLLSNSGMATKRSRACSIM